MREKKQTALIKIQSQYYVRYFGFMHENEFNKLTVKALYKLGCLTASYVKQLAAFVLHHIFTMNITL